MDIIDSIFFLETPLAIVSIIVLGVTLPLITVWFNPSILITSWVLFLIFALNQLIFRLLLDLDPLRLVGQVIYFMIFLISVGIGSVIKQRIG